MRFLVDAQLPPKLCRWLESKGCEAIHVCGIEQGLVAPDAAIWELAKAEARVIVSKDSDFFERAMVLGKPPQVLYVNIGNCSNQDLLALLESRWEDLKAALASGTGLLDMSRVGLGLFDSAS
jgi:predicted nuclease of predicted toxin-antitoxin system